MDKVAVISMLSSQSVVDGEHRLKFHINVRRPKVCNRTFGGVDLMAFVSTKAVFVIWFSLREIALVATDAGKSR